MTDRPAATHTVDDTKPLELAEKGRGTLVWLLTPEWMQEPGERASPAVAAW